jgi:hypothetical protein
MKESSGAGKDGAVKTAAAKTAAKKPAKAAAEKPVKAKRPGRPAAPKGAKPAAKKPGRPAKTAKAPASKVKAPKASRTKTAKTKKAGTAKAAAEKPVKAKRPGRPAAPKGAKPAAKKPAAAKKTAKTATEKPVKAAKKPGRPAAVKRPGRPPKTPVQAAAGKSLALKYCSCPSTELKFSRIAAALSQENILYVLEDTRVLSSWDTSNPREIKKLGEISLERTPFKMKLFGNTLYVLRKPHWLNFKRSYYIDVIDVSNPASFAIKEQIKLDFAVSSLCAGKEGDLLVTGEDGIYRIKAGSPSLVYAFGEELRMESGYVDIAVQGSFCFAAGDHEVGLYIFNMLSDGKLSLLKHLPAPGYLFTEAPIHFYKGGKFVLLVRDETFVMADVKEPDKTKALDTVKIPGLKLCGKIVPAGNEAWLFGLSRTAQDENILAVVDLKETGPVLKTKIGLDGYGHAANDDVKALFRQANYLFVLTFNRGLGLFEIQ